MPAPAIVLQNLTRRFGAITAVDSLSFEVYPGEIFGFLGHNGAGKTTTVRLLNGVLEPHGGSARVLGLDPQTDGPRLRQRTGVLTETPSLDERLSAWDNLAIYADLYGVPRAEITARVEELLRSFELLERAQEKVSHYSRGMKQRLALARALLHRPELLFLDEPTAGLDPLAARSVHHLVARLARPAGGAGQEGCTVFLCTHNLVEAQRLCDRVAVLERGRLMALGTPAELARRYVRRVRVEVEVEGAQVETARAVIGSRSDFLHGEPFLENGVFKLTLAGREAIPELLAALVSGGVRVYQLAPLETELEEVYFALHGEAGEAG